MPGTVKGRTKVGIDERLTALRLQAMATEMGRRFGRRMRERRLELGLKQREVAARMALADPERAAAVSKQHISDWENGVEPSDRYKPLVVQALEVPDVSWFYETPNGSTPDVIGALADESKLDQIAREVSELRDLLLGGDQDGEVVAGIAVRLLQAAGWTPPQADEPPETPEADQQPPSA